MTPQGPGATVSVIVGVTLAILLVNAALAVYAWTRRPATAEHDSAVEKRTRSGDASTVACPNCGAENEPEYRYCRACVSELPGYAANHPQFASPFGRISR
jgi:hypothetical protein